MLTSRFLKMRFIGMLLVCLFAVFSSLASDNSQAIAGKKELKIALKTAKTAEDHQRIATFYQEEARKLESKEKKEQDLADYFLAHPSMYGKQHPAPSQTHTDLAHYYHQASSTAVEHAEQHLKLAAAALRSP
jgi:hypothetical protein